MRLVSFLTAAALLLAALASLAAPVQLTFGGDRFASAEVVAVRKDVAGDLFLAARRVSIRSDTDIDGDLVAAGREVHHEGFTRDDAYIAGERLQIEGGIGGSARLAGNEIRMTRASRVTGNVSAAGSDVHFDGRIDGSLLAAARDLYLNGAVGGDVRISARHLVLGPAARINGVLRYRSNSILERHDGAVVNGGIQRTAAGDDRTQQQLGMQALALWAAGMILLSVVLIGAAPGFTRQLATTMRTRLGGSLLIGFLACLTIPIFGVIAFTTIIGVPFGLLMLLSLAIMLLAGPAIASIAAGDATLRHLSPGRLVNTGWRSISAALAVVLLMLLACLPFIGGVVVSLALLAGMGAILLQLRGRGARAI